MRKTLILILVLFCSFWGFSQEENVDIDEDYLSILLAEDDEEKTSAAFKPVIGFGVGNLSFYGDVTDYFKSPINGLTSYRFLISRNVSKYFDVEFHGTLGRVGGSCYDASNTEKIDFSKLVVNDKINADRVVFLRENDVDEMTKIANFRSQIFAGGVSVAYNFNHLLERKRPIHPYVSLGVEFFQFSSKGDFLNADNKAYVYWADGTIRDSEGEIIVRDYEYETDLRKLDLYGYGDYAKTCVAFPVDAGFNVTISDRVTCRFGCAAHFPLSDYIDNVKGGKGWKNDIVLNTYVSLSVDLFSADDEIAAVENFRNLKFTVTDHLDEDGDGVDDFNDECPGTPKGVKINYTGCPVDTDKDGVPDYIDKEPNTPVGKNVIVSASGIQMNDRQVIMLLYNPDAVKHSETKIYSQTSEGRVDSGEKAKGVPDRFKSVDVNNDNYIDNNELQKAIDAIFEGTSNLTPADINDLQDFFFEQ